jgi:hypothetical protein
VQRWLGREGGVFRLGVGDRRILGAWVVSVLFYEDSKTLFGRAPKGAPAPCGALPNGVRRGGFGHGAAGGAVDSFHWGGGATKTWLQPAPPPVYSFALGAGRSVKDGASQARGGG